MTKRRNDRWCTVCFVSAGTPCADHCDCKACIANPHRLRKRLFSAIREMVTSAVRYFDWAAESLARDRSAPGSVWAEQDYNDYCRRADMILWQARCVAETTKTLDQHPDLQFYDAWERARRERYARSSRCETEKTSSSEPSSVPTSEPSG